jgi:hypothetical protein
MRREMLMRNGTFFHLAVALTAVIGRGLGEDDKILAGLAIERKQP